MATTPVATVRAATSFTGFGNEKKLGVLDMSTSVGP